MTPKNRMDFEKELFESAMNHLSIEELLKFPKVMEIWQQAEQKGVQKGTMIILLDLLEQRFQQVPEWVVSKVQTADTELLRAWLKRIIHANSIEDVFV
ncbi:MAG: hypothetical protein H7839_00660 [Magnetococcus sp. YQC-5]